MKLIATAVLALILVSPIQAKKRPSYKLNVLATAYCLKGYTWSGKYVHPGSVSVDPRIIKMGSYMYVPGYGRGHAEDTGGAIKGRHIDVWFSSCSAAKQWGRKYPTITVYR